jgi:AcrR family transcriptional regulator
MESARARILNTASQLFYAHGLRAVGVDTIIAEANVAKASFYKHFPSKDDLVVAFLEKRDADWREWIKERVAALSPEPEGRPLAMFDALAERMKHRSYRGCAFINSIVEIANHDHAAHRAADTHKRAVITYLEELLRAAGHGPQLAPQLMLLIDGAIVTAVREHSPRAAASAKQIAVQLLKGSPRVASAARRPC